MTTKELIRELKKADPSGRREVFAFIDGERIVADFKASVGEVDLPSYIDDEIHLVILED
jgi:hypothetical protein